MKPSRRRKGATLGLVATCVLVIIVLGVGVFFLAKLFGGGREVANATDAGTLSIAKNALIQPAVQLPSFTPGSVVPFSEFYGCAYPNPMANPSSPSTPVINLFTYNRCVGQAMMIAINAKAEYDAGASGSSNNPLTNAQKVLNDLNAIGKTLKNGLQGQNAASGGLAYDPNNPPSSLGNNFTKNANSSNVAMMTNSQVSGATTYKTAFMKTGGATNVYFSSPYSPTAIPGATGTVAVPNYGATSTSSPDPLNQNPGTGKFYLQGYTGFTVPGTTMTFYGVPVLPQQKPHLVSNDDFNSSQTDTFNGTTPPNSFQVNASAQEQRTGTFGGAVSCAIVGAVFQSTGTGTGANGTSPDFPVAIPSGYIELANPAGNSNLPAGFLPTDNSTNIFNNELYNGPGGGLPGTANGTNQGSGDLYTANASGGNVFGEGAAIQAWMAYNALPVSSPFVASPNNPSSKNLNSTSPATPYPPTIGYSANTGLIYDQGGNMASQATCLTITGPLLDCSYQNSTPGGLTGNCLTDLLSNAFSNVYNHGMPTGVSGAAPPGGVSAVDSIKGEIIANFNGAGYHKDVSVGVSGSSITVNNANSGMSASTGLGEYMSPNGLNGVFATPNPSNQDYNQFPVQNTGSTALPSGGHPSILGLLAQLDSGNGTAASGGAGASPNNNYAFNSQCSSVFQQLLQRVQQIQPACTQANLEALLNGQVQTSAGLQYSLEMGQTAYIFLNNGNLADTTGVTGHGLRIYAEKTGTVPTALTAYTAQQPDGMPISGAAPSCGQTYSLYKGGAGMVDVSINGNSSEVNPKGDDSLHDQPYTNASFAQLPSGAYDYQAQDKGTWVPGSGYGNILGRLSFSDVVTGSATFSSPN